MPPMDSTELKQVKPGPGSQPDEFETLTPREIVARLDEYIIGQDDAKRAIAIAIRNRLRRLQVEGDLRDEIIPKNLILISSIPSFLKRLSGRKQ